MYCTHFGLHRPPFNNTPDPTFYLSTPEHEEALATLQYAVTQRKGFVLVSGEVGAGKTLVGRMFLRQMDRNAAVAVITHTSLSGRQLLAAICAEFELPVPPEATNLQLAERLQAFLLEQFAQDRFVVVLLDEAQNLPDDSFEELRMLGNLEADDAKLLQVCILGQPELRDRFRHPNLRQLDQRLFRRFHLCSLDRQTTEAYILHRLAVAGHTGGELFTPEAIDRIYAASQGTPRIINQICDNALLTAYGQEAHQVDEAIITRVLEHDPVLELHRPAGDRLAETAPPLPDAAHAIHPANLVPTSASTLPAAGMATRDEMGALADHTGRRWRDTQDRLDAFRDDMRATLAQALDQYRTVQQQFDELSRSAAPAAELDHIRKRHLRDTRRIIAEISQQKEEFHKLLKTADARWTETRDLLAAHRDEDKAVPHERLAELEANLDGRLHELLEHLDLQRRQVANLAQTLGEHCERTRRELDEMRQAHAQLEERLSRDAHTRFDELQAALDGRLRRQDERLHALDKDLAARITAADEAITRLSTNATTAAEFQAVRGAQTAALSDLLRRLGEQADGLATLKRQLSEQAEGLAGLEHQLGEQAGGVAGLKRQLAEEVEAGNHDRQAILGQLRSALAEQEEQVRHLRQRLVERLEDAEKRFAALGEQFARKEDLASLRAGQEAELHKVREDQEAIAQTLRARHAEDIESLRAALDARMHEQEKRLQSFDQNLAAQIAAADEAIEKLNASAATAEDLETARREHSAALSHLLGQVGEQADGLVSLGRQLAEQAETGSRERQALLDEFRTTLAEQDQRVRQLRQRLIELIQAAEKRFAALSEQFARKEELAGLRTEQQAAMAELLRNAESQIAGVLHQLEGDRRTVKRLVGGVAQRFRNTHQQIESLVASRALRDEVTALGARHQTETQRVLGMLEEYGRSVEQQFAGVAEQLNAARQELDTLTRAGARVEDLARVERQQIDDREKVLTTLAAQRRDLESLVEGVNERCTELDRQLRALPADLATVPQLDAIRAEYVGQIQAVAADLETRKAHLEQAIQHVARHCDQAHAAVKTLAQHAASSQEVRQLRQDQAQKLQDLQQRLTEQAGRYDQSVNLLAGRIRHHEERVSRIETSERPRPVHIELSPQESSRLADVVTAARTEQEQLNETVERAGAITSHLRNAAGEVQQAMDVWLANSTEVRRQSEQLRTSAEVASRILDAMRKCHAALDQKLNSKRWQTELTRGEQLAGRLEQATREATVVVDRLQAALNDFEVCESSAEEWSRNHQAAQQTTQRLARLLAAASATSSRVDQSLAQRKQVLAAVARNTSRLVSVIDEARRTDEQERPTASLADSAQRPAERAQRLAESAQRLATPSPDAEGQPKPARPAKQRIPARPNPQRSSGRVTPVDWPAFRTHPAAEVG